jgi:cytochrome c oxidase assembly protein subunit 11
MTETPNHPTAKIREATSRRDLIVAASCGAFVAAMVGLSYASVPFYDWFCRATGFAGRPQIATSLPQGKVGRTVRVRFDANVTGGLPWRFEPEQNEIKVRLGEVVTVNYMVTNLAARETVGQAAYNVAPSTTGAYFQKINCFCFTEQRMAPGEKREMAVVFYVDASLAKDSELDDLDTITLSYSFYAVREPARPVADAATSRTGKL